MNIIYWGLYGVDDDTMTRTKIKQPSILKILAFKDSKLSFTLVVKFGNAMVGGNVDFMYECRSVWLFRL